MTFAAWLRARSGPGHKLAFDNALALVGCPDRCWGYTVGYNRKVARPRLNGRRCGRHAPTKTHQQLWLVQGGGHRGGMVKTAAAIIV